MVWLRFVMTRMPRFFTVISLPIAAFFGVIGYNVERFISDRHTPGTAPIVEQRSERLLESIEKPDFPKKKHNPLEVNLSPSLSS